MSRLRDLFTCMLLIGIGAGMGSGTVAAMGDSTSNDANRVKVGTVQLSNDAGGTAVFNVSGAMPGSLSAKCVRVTYGGTLDAQVRLFGTVSGNLAPHLTLEVVRGTKPAGAAGDCSGFVADTADHAGLGAGVLWRGDLDDFPGAGTPILDPATWTQGDAHAYQFRLTMRNDEAAQGQSATMSFTWEAQNL